MAAREHLKAWDLRRVAEVDPAVRRDIEALRARRWLDPKRFYKTKGEDADLMKRLDYFQMGTVVPGAFERSITQSVPRRTRPGGLMDELLRSDRVRSFTSRTFDKSQAANAKAGRGAARQRAQQAHRRPSKRPRGGEK